MALLQRTLASSSIWIGTGQSSSNWGEYWTTQHVPFNITDGSNSLLYYSHSTNANVFGVSGTIQSPVYIPGFSPAHAPNLGFAIRNDSGYYTAQFDNISIRGAMNVHQFVINQIRSTNGDLWVSDAAKATAASTSSTNLVLHFESGSLVPFIANDIIRSKRINPEGASINSWDIIAKVTSVDSSGAAPGLTASLTSPDYWTSSGSDLGNLISSPSSQWVRIGNTSTVGRQGGLYLSGGGNATSPFMDIYNGVTTIAEAHDSTDTSSVSRSKLVSRFGNLQEFNAGSFGNLSGYGLWASGSVYLEGKIIAREGGTISNWTITDNSLSASGIKLTGGNTPSIQIGAANSFANGSGIFMSGSSNGAQFRIGQPSASNNKFIQWDNSDLIINSTNFRLAGGNVTMSGNITAQTGNIGGWTIGNNKLYSGNVTLSSLSGNSYLGIGSSGYNSTGIYIGSHSAGGNRLSLVSGNNKLLWNGSDIGITTSNFTLSGGNITAKGGTIAAWSIGADSMSATTGFSSLILRNDPSPAWDIVGSSGYQHSWQDSAYFNWKGKYFSTGSSFEPDKSPWSAISNTSSVSSLGLGQTNIGFTVSAAGMDKTLVTWKSTHPDTDKITALPGETIHIIINTMSVTNTTLTAGNMHSPFDLLQLNLINKTGGTTRSVLHSFLLPEIGQTTAYTQNEQIYPGVFATSFTNNSTIGETYSILISVTSSIRGTAGNESLPNFNYNLVIKGLGVGSAKGYTELNSQGLLVYAGPSNFIKISTGQLSDGNSGSNLGIIAVDTIVGGNTTYGYSGGGGTSGGIDGAGTAGSIPVWSDSNTIADSIVSQNQNGDLLTVDGDITTSGYIEADGAITSSTGFKSSGTSQLGTLNLDTDLTVLNGGTGKGSFTPNGVLYGNNTNGLLVTDAGGANSVLIANGGAPSFSQNLTLGGNISGSGTLQVGNNATFANPITVSSPTTQAPFNVASATKVVNLNADTVDGIDISSISKGGILYASTTTNITNVVLSGVLKGNNTNAPTVMTGTANRVTRWSDATTIKASSTIYDDETKVTVSVPFTASSGIETVNLVATGTNNNLGTISTGTWNGSTIAVNKGGTGQTSYTNGQLLIGNATGNTLTKATLTQGTGVSITNGAGSITIAIGQSVATTASPTFAGITLSNLTLNTLPIASNSGSLINSQITDNGSLITLGRATYVNGNFQANGTASATQITASVGVSASLLRAGTGITTSGYLSVKGNASVQGTLGVIGISTLGITNVSNLSSTGTISAVTGFTSSTGYLRIGGAITASALRNIAGSFIVNSSGDLECHSLKETSLRQYKHEIQYITESQLLNISKLKPVTFLYNQDVPQDVNDTRLRQAGFIAEQVQQIYPEVAWYKDGQLAGLQYQRLTAYLTRGIQELAEQNKLLKSRVQSLEQLVNGILQGAKQ